MAREKEGEREVRRKRSVPCPCNLRVGEPAERRERGRGGEEKRSSMSFSLKHNIADRNGANADAGKVKGERREEDNAPGDATPVNGSDFCSKS